MGGIQPPPRREARPQKAGLVSAQVRAAARALDDSRTVRSPYLPLADIAVIYGVSPRTARRWAAHDRWRRTGTRPVRYSLADAQGSYEAHAACVGGTTEIR